jgi:DNA-binding MarR family transcriptional regulator
MHMRTRTNGKIDFVALADFRYHIRRFLSFSENAARGMRIEPQQHQALLAIKGLRPDHYASVGALAERLQIRHHSVVELADRLERRKLVKRARSGADRREVHLTLTPRGEKILRALSRVHREELRTAGPRLVKALRAAIDGRRPR